MYICPCIKVLEIIFITPFNALLRTSVSKHIMQVVEIDYYTQ